MRKKLILAFSVMLCMAFAMSAQEPGDPDWQNIYFIEPGTQWEVEVKSNVNPGEPAIQVTEWLEGSEMIDGKWYLKLWVKIGEEAPRMTTYIRMQVGPDARIYAMDPENMERGERLIYVFFYNRNMPEEPLASLNWDGTLSDEEYSFSMKSGEGFENSGYKWGTEVASIYPSGAEKSAENCLGNVTWVYGLGGMCGFTNQCYAINSDYTTTLKRMVTHCSGVVYDSTGMNGIENIDAEDTMSPTRNVKYHLDGTLFNEGEKGIYIMNGKKYIAR